MRSVEERKHIFCVFVFVFTVLVPLICGQPKPQSANLGLQIACTGQNPTRYVYYGCWCGPTNTGGRTVDGIDRCCRSHDFCFRDVRRNHGISNIEAFATLYSFRCRNRTPTCTGGNAAGRGLCECDRAMAVCTHASRRDYSLRRVFLPWLRNRRCRN